MIKKIMKTVLCACMVLTALLFATEEIEPGITWIKDDTKTVFVNKVIGARAATDTINSAVYEIFSIQQASEYHNLRVVIDSGAGAFDVAIDLFESYDGVHWYVPILLGTITVDTARIDTFFEVNLYPKPYNYLMFRETDAATNESCYVDTAMWFNPHK